MDRSQLAATPAMAQTRADLWNSDVMGRILWLNEVTVTIQLINSAEFTAVRLFRRLIFSDYNHS